MCFNVIHQLYFNLKMKIKSKIQLECKLNKKLWILCTLHNSVPILSKIKKKTKTQKVNCFNFQSTMLYPTELASQINHRQMSVLTSRINEHVPQLHKKEFNLLRRLKKLINKKFSLYFFIIYMPHIIQYLDMFASIHICQNVEHAFIYLIFPRLK